MSEHRTNESGVAEERDAWRRHAQTSDKEVAALRGTLAAAREAWANFDQRKLDELLGEPQS